MNFFNVSFILVVLAGIGNDASNTTLSQELKADNCQVNEECAWECDRRCQQGKYCLTYKLNLSSISSNGIENLLECVGKVLGITAGMEGETCIAGETDCRSKCNKLSACGLLVETDCCLMPEDTDTADF